MICCTLCLSVQLFNMKKKIIIICTHFLRDRSSRKDSDFLQPMIGVHIASCIDKDKYDIQVYNEMSMGPYDVENILSYDIVFLSGLQKDFDRMRQLSFYFKRSGAIVVAGGSICTLYPGFASQFFDVVCGGGVDSVFDVMSDYENYSLKEIYISHQHDIRDYRLNHSILKKDGIYTQLHLIEASRGCNYTCGFCTIPAEKAKHTIYSIERLIDDIRDAMRNNPLFSFRRFYPGFYFIDNHFTLNREHTKAVCKFLKNERRIKGWGALITQNDLSDRALIKMMKSSKCQGVFTGLESIDIEFLKRNNKNQNLINVSKILNDVKNTQKEGIMVNYGYLFDPRVSSTEEMLDQLNTVINSDVLLFPCFFSFVSPLLGTKIFWESVESGELLPNLRLRDLDGCTLAYSNIKSEHDAITRFADLVLANPHKLISKMAIFKKTIKYIIDFKIKLPHKWYIVYRNNIRPYQLFKQKKGSPVRNYIGGTDILDPQYDEYPDDITDKDKKLFFDPIMVTDSKGDLENWLKDYVETD